MPKLAEHYVEIGAKLDKFNKGMSDAQRKMVQMGQKFSAIGKKLSIAVTLPIVAIGGAAIKTAMDAIESESLFEVSMKGMADSARKWSEKLRDELGLNSYEVRKSTGVFNVMMASMGLSEQAAYGMATGLTELAYDMASFYNLKPDEIFIKLQSAISGEVEPLKRLGIIVNETTIKTWALTNGMIRQGETMTEAQKVAARFNVIMERTVDAQGDLARTMDSPTNKIRIMKSRITELGIEIGMKLLPVFEKILSHIEKGIKWFSGLDDSTKELIIKVAGLIAVAGPLLFIFGKLLVILPALKVAFATLLGPIGLIGVAVAAGTVLWIKYKAAMDELKSAEERENEQMQQQAKRWSTVATAAGLTTKEMMAMTRAYDGNYSAMFRAIKQGKEGKVLQEAYTDTIKKLKAEQVEATSVMGDYLKGLDSVEKKQRTWIDYLHDIGLKTVEEKREKIAELNNFLEKLNEAYSQGKVDLEAYTEAQKIAKEELIALTETLVESTLPATRDLSGVLVGAVVGFEDLGYGVETALDKLLKKWPDFVDVVKADLEYIAQTGIMNVLDAFHRWGEEGGNILTNLGEAMHSFVGVALDALKQLVVGIFTSAIQNILAKQAEAIAGVIASVMTSIPFPMNLILVGGAIAAVSALFAGLKPKKMERGGWIPQPMLVEAGHGPRGEIIAQPAKLAEIISREMPKVAPIGAGINITYAPQISAMDSQDVYRFMTGPGRDAFEKMIRSNVRGIAQRIKEETEKF